jgi:hypothetical protein
MLCVGIILDLLLEVLIIHSSPHQIPTQGISIRMPHSLSVDYLETVVLEQVNPPTPSSMRIKHSRQPFERLMVRPQHEVGSMQVLSEVQDPPDQSIAFPFHGVKLLLSHSQCLAGVGYDPLKPPLFL